MDSRVTNAVGMSGWGAVLGATALIGAMTLSGSPEAAAAAERTAWWCLACGSIGVADLAQNIVLFVPLGFALARARVGIGVAAAVMLALTLGIELLQASVIAGRDASLGDVSANAVGGLVGWGLWACFPGMFLPGRRRALSVVAALGAAFAVTAVTATALLRPALSRADYTRARLAPEVEGRARFAGTVLGFSVGNDSYADRDVPVSLPIGDLGAAATVIWPGSGQGNATIARIDGSSGDAILSIDQRESTVRVHAFSGASAWRLRSPAVAVPLPPGTVAGDTLAIQFTWHGNEVALVAQTSRGESRTAGRYRPWDGWVLFNPFTGGVTFDARQAAWTILWILAWALGIGWYGYRALRTPT